MSCTRWESDVALYVGGDLPEHDAERVEQHLADCAECRTLAEELCTELGALAELRDEPLEDAMVAQVRRGVMSRIEGRRPWRLYWGLALAAAVLVAVVLMWPQTLQKQVAPVAARVPEAPTSRAGWEPAAGRGPAPRKHRKRRVAPAEPTLLVQFVTDDPNIVIYWLVDQKPQGD